LLRGKVETQRDLLGLSEVDRSSRLSELLQQLPHHEAQLHRACARDLWGAGTKRLPKEKPLCAEYTPIVQAIARVGAVCPLFAMDNRGVTGIVIFKTHKQAPLASWKFCFPLLHLKVIFPLHFSCRNLF
jgi:hypothetical protein